MAEVISQIDPSGTFSRYLRGESPKNLLWVCGSGSNGKTTLLNTIDALQIHLEDVPSDLPQFVVIYDGNSISPYKSSGKSRLSLLQQVVSSHPQTRFFIESNVLPPSKVRDLHENFRDFECEILHLEKRFK